MRYRVNRPPLNFQGAYDDTAKFFEASFEWAGLS
jgi:hypothetical protein